MDYQQLPSVQALAIAGLPTSVGGGNGGGVVGNSNMNQSAPHQQLQHIMQQNNNMVQQNVQQLLTSMQPPPLPPLPSLNTLNINQNLANMQQLSGGGGNNNGGGGGGGQIGINGNVHGNNAHTLAHLNNLLVNNQNNQNNQLGVLINNNSSTTNNNNPSMPNNNLHALNTPNGNGSNNSVQQQPLPPSSQLLQLHHQNVLNNNNNNSTTINQNNVATLVANNGANNNNNNNGVINNNNSNTVNGNITNGEEGNRWTQFQVQQLWRHHAYLNGKSGNSKDICGDDKFKEDGDPWNVEAQAAFLGPNLWDKTLPYDTDLKYADLDEFLSENNIPDGLPGSHLAHSTGLSSHQSTSLLGLGHITTKRERSPSPSDCVSPDTINPPSPAESTFSFASSGRDFDPRTRAFSDEELKPQPMIKKSRKQFVPDELKDDKYWARRRKNNIAAKRSRDARRQKENQIAMRARYLEKEVLLQNSTLHQELEQLKQENMELRARLSKYQDV